MSEENPARDTLPGRVDRYKRRHPELDESLRRYRERKRTYDSKRISRPESPQYRTQRGVRRDYRV